MLSWTFPLGNQNLAYFRSYKGLIAVCVKYDMFFLISFFHITFGILNVLSTFYVFYILYLYVKSKQMAKSYGVLSEISNLINSATGIVNFGFTFGAITFLCKFLKELAGLHYLAKARYLIFFVYFNISIFIASRGHKKVCIHYWLVFALKFRYYDESMHN